MAARKPTTTKTGFFKKKLTVFIFINLLILIFLITILGLSFRTTRDALPPTEISTEKIVGFTQYFGYPFYLDTVTFFVFILSPLITAFLFYIKYENDQK